LLLVLISFGPGDADHFSGFLTIKIKKPLRFNKRAEYGIVRAGGIGAVF